MTTRDPLDELLDMDATPWRPDPGDRIKGHVVEITETVSDYGPYPIVVIKDTDGAYHSVHAFRTVLKNELQAKHACVGDRVAIKYIGRADGKNYDSYKVAVEPGPNHYAAQAATPVARPAVDPGHPALAPTDAPTAGQGWDPDTDTEPF